MPDTLHPIRIDPQAIYTDGELRLLLDLPGATLARERRAGRLRSTRKGHRTYYLGSWVLAWLTSEGRVADARYRGTIPQGPRRCRGGPGHTA